MLAQGQSSSAKRGGLAEVSSGLIFLKKKKKRRKKKEINLKQHIMGKYFEERLKRNAFCIPSTVACGLHSFKNLIIKIIHQLMRKLRLCQVTSFSWEHTFIKIATFRKLKPRLLVSEVCVISPTEDKVAL